MPKMTKDEELQYLRKMNEILNNKVVFLTDQLDDFAKIIAETNEIVKGFGNLVKELRKSVRKKKQRDFKKIVIG